MSCARRRNGGAMRFCRLAFTAAIASSFFLDDTPVYPAAFFGAVRAGLVPLLINLLTPSDLLQFYLADSGATIAVTEAACVEKFNATACANTELKTLVIVNGQVVSASSVGTINAASWLRTFSSALVPADTHRDEMAFWMYLSGSTGRPKGIVHLQHDMIYTDLAYARSILRLTPDDICFSVPKIFFAYGLGNSITFPFCAGAASLLLPGSPSPRPSSKQSRLIGRPCSLRCLRSTRRSPKHQSRLRCSLRSLRLKFFQPKCSMPGKA
jgi:acyl-coenzyme A synthetase/AMP-(fatty) acid ligase